MIVQSLANLSVLVQVIASKEICKMAEKRGLSFRPRKRQEHADIVRSLQDSCGSERDPEQSSFRKCTSDERSNARAACLDYVNEPHHGGAMFWRQSSGQKR
jgi:hypothetical protein